MRVKSDALFSLAFLSLFFPLPVYPAIFLAFSFLVFLRDRRSVDFGNARDIASMATLLFIMIGVSVSWMNSKFVWSDPGVKLVINMLFLAAVLRWDVFLTSRQEIMNSLATAITISVILTGIQVAINATVVGAWMDPFYGIEDSMAAYKIVLPGVYWGIAEKNIWATKVALQSILIFYIISRRLVKVNYFVYAALWIASIIAIIYTFSRTAQAVFFGFVFWEYYLRNIDLRSIKKKPFHVIIGGSILFVLGWKAYDKMFHLTLQPGDGMESRIRMWTYLWSDHSLIDFLLGKGYFYGRDFLPKYEMVESNFHNVFINILTDFGFLGIASYLILIIALTRIVNLSLLVYILMVSMVQYSGFDNDIVVYVSAAIIISGSVKFSASMIHKYKGVIS